MEGRREVSIISLRPVTGSDLKQERLFCRQSVGTFLQLVVAVYIWGLYLAKDILELEEVQCRSARWV